MPPDDLINRPLRHLEVNLPFDANGVDHGVADVAGIQLFEKPQAHLMRRERIAGFLERFPAEYPCKQLPLFLDRQSLKLGGHGVTFSLSQ